MDTVLAYDTETTGLRAHDGDKMFAFSVGDVDGGTETHRVDAKGTPGERKGGRKRAREIWNGEQAVVMHNAKFDISMTEYYLKQNLRGVPIHDTIIQSHIMRNDHPSHRLKDVCWELAGIPRDDEKDVKAFVNANATDYSQVPRALMERYQALDAERCMLLHLFFYPMIQKRPALREIYQTEIDLVWTTLRMERRGLMLRKKRCHQMIDELAERMEVAADDLSQIAGERINPRKDTMLRWLLYKKLGLPVLARTAKTREPSTAKVALAQLWDRSQHPAIDAIRRYRSFYRGRGTIQSYLDLGGKRRYSP